jgi:deoxyadenosine/deoxycytidine kinase
MPADTRFQPPAAWVSVEGCAGAGKSSVLREVAATAALLPAEVVVLQEAVDAWTDPANGDVLQAFYRDPARHTFALQVLAHHTRREAMLDACHRPAGSPPWVLVTERCFDTDRAFAEKGAARGHITPAEMGVYRAMHADAAARFGRPTAHVFLDTPPAEAAERVGSRDREAERGVVDATFVSEMRDHQLAALPPERTRRIANPRNELAATSRKVLAVVLAHEASEPTNCYDSAAKRNKC